MHERKLLAVKREHAQLEEALKHRVSECDEVYASLQSCCGPRSSWSRG
jgi:hypothetical protein